MVSFRFRLAVLLLVVLFVPIAALSAETLGSEIYSVAIPFAKESFSKEEIGQEFRQYRDARIFEEESANIALVGGFLRASDAATLLAHFQEKYPEAEVLKPAELTGTAQPLQAVSPIRLRDAGYDRDSIAYGPRPFIGVSFPWVPGPPAEGSTLTLKLRKTPLLKFPSAVTVKISGVTVGFYELSNQSEEIDLTVPLARFADTLKDQFRENRLHVTIEGSLRLFDDPCKDIQASELWLSLSRDSVVEIAHRYGDVALNSFFSSAFPSLTVVADEKEPAAVEAALTVVGAAKATSPSLPVSFASPPAVNPFGATAVIGDFDEDLTVSHSTLYLTPKGARLLGDQISSLLATPQATALSWQRTAWNESGSPLPFSALGFQTTSVAGRGELAVRVPFTLPQLGTFPQSLTAVFKLIYSPLPETDKGMLKVRLNGTLVAARRLDHEGMKTPFTLTFPLPVDKLAQRNQLDAVFTYFADEGRCSGASPTMEATLFEESSLLVGAPDQTRQLLLDSAVGQMRGRGAVLMPEPSVLSLAPLVDWAAMYGELHQQAPDITVMQTLPAEEQFDYYLASTANGSTLPGIEPLVATGKDLIVRNPLTGETPVQVKIGSPLWIAQTFRHQNAPMMLFSCLARGEEPMPELTLTHMQRLGGNVAVGKGEQWQAMTIGRKLTAAQPDKPDFAYYWSVYKTTALVILAGIVLLFFYYVYTHLTGRKHGGS